MMFGLKRISTALGLLAVMAMSATAQEVAPNANQVTADAVASSLRASRNLAGYRIEIQVRGGLVTLTGSVAEPAQKAEALARAQQVAGLAGVVDQLHVGGDPSVRPVQYVPQVALGHHGGYGGGGPIYDVGTGMGATAAPMASGGPMPEGPAGMTGATQAAMPGYPNYAWPSYAPYPNFSAVGYPTAYPWQAWPNIGPFYPYPEVPLDWRAVTLRWDDGIWWLDFKRNYTRPFFTPYPFGIMAY
ncbi:MAG TPA: BON domain-containing protein [Isosphaeraceae bacterium]|nr:BON domain-containing protein [Isosphaeraceae bacterium]